MPWASAAHVAASVLATRRARTAPSLIPWPRRLRLCSTLTLTLTATPGRSHTRPLIVAGSAAMVMVMCAWRLTAKVLARALAQLATAHAAGQPRHTRQGTAAPHSRVRRPRHSAAVSAQERLRARARARRVARRQARRHVHVHVQAGRVRRTMSAAASTCEGSRGKTKTARGRTGAAAVTVTVTCRPARCLFAAAPPAAAAGRDPRTDGRVAAQSLLSVVIGATRRRRPRRRRPHRD